MRCPLHVHGEDAPAVFRVCAVGENFSERRGLGEGFEAATLGHGAGASSFL